MNRKAINRLHSKMIARSLLALAVLITSPQVFANHLQCPDGNTTDSDGDALLDCWETDGIDIDDDGVTDLVLYDTNQNGNIDPGEGADPNHKDIYLEVDWMAEHQPNPAAIDLVVNSFANAPVNNPDGTQGIRLHILADEQALAHNNSLAFTGSTSPAGLNDPDFDNVKTNWFGTVNEWNNANNQNILSAKRQAFHYVLFVHNLQGLGATSGTAETPGNDFVVSLGSWAQVNGHGVGSVDEQAGTLMHEFGHNLGLRHGGLDNVNCKPNYLSVMSYSRQTDSNPIVGRPLDYSRSVLPTLDENNLNESAGVGGSPGDLTAYGPSPVLVVFADRAINWNRNNIPFPEAGVGADINNNGGSCPGNDGTTLVGYNDWGNIQYNLRSSGSFADGVRLAADLPKEMDIDQEAKGGVDSDGDGIANIKDNCPFTANSYQSDSDHNGVGDRCQKKPAESIKSLVKEVYSLTVSKKLKHKLIEKLKAASRSDKKGDIVAAVNHLQAFIGQVNENTGQDTPHYYAKGKKHKKISGQQNLKLVTAARQIDNNIEAKPVPHHKWHPYGYHH